MHLSTCDEPCPYLWALAGCGTGDIGEGVSRVGWGGVRICEGQGSLLALLEDYTAARTLNLNLPRQITSANTTFSLNTLVFQTNFILTDHFLPPPFLHTPKVYCYAGMGGGHAITVSKLRLSMPVGDDVLSFVYISNQSICRYLCVCSESCVSSCVVCVVYFHVYMPACVCACMCLRSCLRLPVCPSLLVCLSVSHCRGEGGVVGSRVTVKVLEGRVESNRALDQFGLS
jgi:hypothetical protein